MFKVVRDFVPQPALMLLCDKACSIYMQAPVEAGKEYDTNVQAAFIAAAVNTGWKVGLDQQICPKHVEKQRSAVSGLIIPTTAVS